MSISAPSDFEPKKPTGVAWLANPSVFLALSARLLPWLSLATILCFAIGLYMALVLAPADYQQGETVRIMFVHVPTAWLGMACYTLMTLSSIGMLVWRHPLADVAARAAAPLGAAFTFICLITGSLWGRPMWGTYWEWDGRLTSMLVLLLIYLGLMALRAAMDDPNKAAKAAALLTIVGFVNIPIIKFSVEWWNTLHQPASVIRLGGSALHPSILHPLLVMALAFTLLFVTLHVLGMRTLILRQRIRTLLSLMSQRKPTRMETP